MKILFDLDGVIYDGDEAIAGAAETLAWAREEGVAHLFVTNTTSRPRSALVEKLRGLDIPAEEDQIWTPAAATLAWLRKQPQGDVAAFVPQATRGELDELSLLPEDAESGARYVVIGDLGEAWDYATLNRAFRLLHSNSEARLIALGMTRYRQAPSGVSLDVAPFVKALEHAADREAIVLGKPAQAFFHAAADRLDAEPAELLMIGDDVRSDVGGAQAAGMKGALVRTGKFREEDLEGEVEPDLVLDSVADLPEAFPPA